MILPVYTYGQPVLRKVAEDITPNYPKLPELIDNMFQTMYDSDGIGLAAPQIGLSIRLVVVSLDEMQDAYPEYKGYKKVFINPHIIDFDDSKTSSVEEGCLSLPNIHETVKRPNRIRVRYLDENFRSYDEWVDGFLARVMQHEFDHLDGKLFIDRISPLRKQMIKKKLSMLLKGKISCSYKVKPLK